MDDKIFGVIQIFQNPMFPKIRFVLGLNQIVHLEIRSFFSTLRSFNLESYSDKPCLPEPHLFVDDFFSVLVREILCGISYAVSPPGLGVSSSK